MMESILDSVKKQLGGEPNYDFYDHDIITCINSVFATLNQLGVGPEKNFLIEDNTTIWSCFSDQEDVISLVKMYMYSKVKLLFDPPLNSTLVDLLKEQCKEYEFRLSILCENRKENDE